MEETHVIQVELEVRAVVLDIDQNGGSSPGSTKKRPADVAGGIDVSSNLQQHLQLFGPQQEMCSIDRRWATIDGRQ